MQNQVTRSFKWSELVEDSKLIHINELRHKRQLEKQSMIQQKKTRTKSGKTKKAAVKIVVIKDKKALDLFAGLPAEMKRMF